MEKKISEAIEKVLEENNIKLINVHLGIEDNVKTLFVTIDSSNGVDTDLCVKAMKLVSPIIDSLDLDLDEYVLDVGSKGE